MAEDTRSHEERITEWANQPDCSREEAEVIVALEDVSTALNALDLIINTASVLETPNAVEALRHAEKRIIHLAMEIEFYPSS